MIPRHFLRLFGAITAAFLLFSATGCGSVGIRKEQALAQAMQSMQPAAPRAIIEIRDGDRKSDFMEFELQNAMTVGDALESSGLVRKYSAMNAELVRNTPEGGPVRLPVRYDRVKRRVEPRTDYMLHPGDRIVVEDRPLAGLEQMFGPLLEPLGPLLKRADRVAGSYQRY